MVLWLIILAAALGGGLVLLHGFGKWKAGGEQMLTAYRHTLDQATELRRRREQATAAGARSYGSAEAVPVDENKQDTP